MFAPFFFAPFMLLYRCQNSHLVLPPTLSSLRDRERVQHRPRQPSWLCLPAVQCAVCVCDAAAVWTGIHTLCTPSLSTCCDLRAPIVRPCALAHAVPSPCLCRRNQQVQPSRHHAFFYCESVGYVRHGVGDLALLASLCVCCSCRRPPARGSRIRRRGSSCQDTHRWEDASCSHEVSRGPKCRGQRYRTSGKR